MDAFRCQFEEELSGQGHRLVGNILLENGWLTSEQVETVLNVMMKRMRLEGADAELTAASAQG